MSVPRCFQRTLCDRKRSDRTRGDTIARNAGGQAHRDGWVPAAGKLSCILDGIVFLQMVALKTKDISDE